MKVNVICRSSQGEPDIFTAEVTASAVQLRNGDHYDIARNQAAEAGYEGTKDAVCVDEQDHLFRRIRPTAAERNGSIVEGLNETEFSEILEIAHVALRDADLFDFIANKLDLSDDYMIALRDKVNNLASKK